MWSRLVSVSWQRNFYIYIYILRLRQRAVLKASFSWVLNVVKTIVSAGYCMW